LTPPAAKKPEIICRKLDALTILLTARATIFAWPSCDFTTACVTAVLSAYTFKNLDIQKPRMVFLIFTIFYIEAITYS
jgi:hypothetical protein